MSVFFIKSWESRNFACSLSSLTNFLCGESIKETKKKLVKYYGESVPSHGMVHTQFTGFCCDRTSTNNAKRTGRSKKVISQEMIDKIHAMVLEDHRLEISQICGIVKIPTEHVFHIMHECLGTRKLWIVPNKPAPKRAITVPSADKVMVTIFCDSHGKILINHLQEGMTITREYYA